MIRTVTRLLLLLTVALSGAAFAQQDVPQPTGAEEYLVGAGDILTIDVLQPDKLTSEVTVAPDGTIAFAYIGTVKVADETLSQVQKDIQARLADGYMKYPVVTVALKTSESKKFFVYGEVSKPGSYLMEEKTTVLKAISMAGGFTKFASSSRVKVLHPKKDGLGYEVLLVNIRKVMEGGEGADLVLHKGDIVVVSEGIF